ncbi:MAG: AAA family ATPase [Lutibacter sp.]
MRIKELKLNNWEVIRQADLLDLSDFVVIAGPNGVGKTKIKNAIVHVFQNGGNPPSGSSVILESTNQSETDSWGQSEFNLPQTSFWSYITTNTKRLKTKSRLIQIDSNRSVESVQFQQLTFNQIGDPENEEVGYNYGYNNVKDRFADICRTLHRLKSKEVTSVYTEYNKLIDITKPNVTLNRLEDPTEKYIELFGKLLYPKTMLPIDINSTTIQYKDEEGATRNFDALSSGEREVVVLTFDILTQHPNDCIILIDEPEVHLHPELTFRLIKVLKSIGYRNQFFLFTHSPDIIGNSLESGVHFIRPKSRVTTGNQVIKIDNNNLEGFKYIPNIRETIGMVSVGKKLLFVEGKSTSIDRDVFATLAKASKTDVAIIPSDSCSNINNMSLISETLDKGVFGIELNMIRDRDGLTDEQIVTFTTKSNGKLNFLPVYHIENFFVDPLAIHVIAKKILLDKAPSVDEITNRIVAFAKKQLNHTAVLYVKSEIYFQAGNFDISPNITINETTTIDQLSANFNTKRNELLSQYSNQFDDIKIKERLIFWTTRLENSIKNGWSDDAKKYFIGKRLLKDIQNSIFGTKTISLWEHIINSEELECQNAIKPLKELMDRI